MNKLGIIGGMGPLADESFIKLLNTCSSGGTDSSHIPFILDCNCARADRSTFLCGSSADSPFDSLKESIKNLLSFGCNALVMPCNTAHYWHKELKAYIPPSIPFPSMPVLTASSAAEKSSHAMLLSTEGTRLCGVYDEYFEKFKIKSITPTDEIISLTSNVIHDVKSGKAVCISSLLRLCSEHTDSVILGCTELSRALLESSEPIPHKLCITDSLSVLASFTSKWYFDRKFCFRYA